MRYTIVLILFLVLSIYYGLAQKLIVQSPNQKISVALFNQQNTDAGEWYLKASYNNDGIHDKSFLIQHLVVDRTSSVGFKLLRRGGFATSLIPLE